MLGYLDYKPVATLLVASPDAAMEDQDRDDACVN